jgi:hypothetical protein
MRYAILLQPAANRVYARAAPALGRAELSVINVHGLQGRLVAVGEEKLGGVPYLTFATAEGTALSAGEVAVLSNLSCLYALFERQVDGRLRPVELDRLDRWDDDLLTIQRYTGKTNEQLTHLLVNLALVVGHGANGMSGGSPTARGRLRVLDPLCGRGTTLNQAVMYGLDAVGIELDPRDVDAYVTFFTTWLKDKRVVHKVERQRVRRDGRVAGHRVTISFAVSRAAQRAGPGQRVVVVADDTGRAGDHVGEASVDAIVADLPYGVRHGSRAGDQLHLGRRPVDLLPSPFRRGVRCCAPARRWRWHGTRRRSHPRRFTRFSTMPVFRWSTSGPAASSIRSTARSSVTSSSPGAVPEPAGSGRSTRAHAAGQP